MFIGEGNQRLKYVVLTFGGSVSVFWLYEIVENVFRRCFGSLQTCNIRPSYTLLH